MIRRLLEKLKKKKVASEIRVGDLFWTDSWDLIAGRPMEHLLHGLRRIGGEMEFEPIYGPETCKMRVVKTLSMPYYILECDVLTFSVKDTNRKGWLPRSQPRRIAKEEFHSWIVEGRVRKEP